MSDQTIIAIYHEGAFHPTTPKEVTLHEGDKVKLSIEKIDDGVGSERLARVKRIMDVIDHFYEGLDDDKIDEIEEAILRRVNFDDPKDKAQFDLTQTALLDSTTVIAILRRDPQVMDRATTYLLEHSYFCFSIITQYEALRGFYLYNSTRQFELFLRLCQDSQIVQLDATIIERASMIYALLYRQGQLISDSDILIAATAIVNNWRLVTENERHLRRVPDLIVENWLASTND